MDERDIAVWWDRAIEPTWNDGIDEVEYDIRLLMCSMFERAWNDLAFSPDIKPDDRRSAIKWFRGVDQEKVLFNYRFCAQVIGINRQRQKLIDERVRFADGIQETTLEKEVEIAPEILEEVEIMDDAA